MGEHVGPQENREPEDRLTHVSTVLRYPAPPQWRGDRRADLPLRLRLPAGMISRARTVSLRLPGQSLRAHRDYQARLLTDAVMTAIAVQEPFSDEFLAGLLPLLRHGAAVGLWQLAVEVTSTVPENAIRDAAEQARSQVGGPAAPLGAEEAAARRRLLLVAEALDEEVSWHSPARFHVAANIARDMLSGAGASVNERLLYEQRSEWDEMRLDLRGNGPRAARYMRGTSGENWTGRGGSAVWRAERRVELQDFEDWLINCPEAGPAERQVKPPGWRVRVPGTWHARVPAAAASEIPEPYATWLAAGRLLAFPVGRKQVIWPLIRCPGTLGWAPAPGVAPVVAAAGGLPSDRVSSFIEAMLVDWSCEYENLPLQGRLHLLAGEAYDFGFIGADEQRYAMAGAHATTVRDMTGLLDGLPGHERAELQQAIGDARLFVRIVARLGIEFRTAEATCVWPGRSVADEILAGHPADAIQWLARQAYQTCTQILGQSMELAWHDAFYHHPAVY